MPSWALVLVAMVVPFAWAVLVARIASARDQRKARFVPPEKPPSDYSI